MPRSSHSPATLGPQRRHHSGSRLLHWMLLAIVALTAVPVFSHAQIPGDPPGLRMVVATDRLEYKPGEPVRITIKVTNPSNTERIIHFADAYQVDYVIDGVWRWSDDKGFTQATTSIRIPAGGTHTFPEFTHLPSDHFLAAGRHEIVAELRGGQNIRAVTSIAVAGDGDEPIPTGFLLSATVSPNPVPFGSTVELAVTVTNASNTAKTFGHDGCPVHYMIDGVYSPPLACPEYWNQVTLQPGQSIEFTAAQFSYLIIPTGRPNGLWPGHHSISIQVPGVGATAVRLEVTGEPGEVGSIAGHVSGENGEALEGVLVEAFTWSPHDSTLTGPGPNGNGTWDGYQAVTGPDGAYIISHLPVSPYLVRASRWGSAEIWYNGAYRPEEASPVYVNAGATTNHIDFVLPLGPPPPPEFDAFITGRVTNDVGNTDQPTVPLADAIVFAIPVRDAWPDSGGDPDETGTTRPWPPGNDPMYGNGFYGFPDSTGLYTIHLPLGTYRVIASAPGSRYEWWEESPNTDGADDVQAHSIYIDSIPPSIDFTLTPITANALTAHIEGTILGVTSDDHGYPPPDSGWVQPNSHPAEIVPLAGARVMARPLIRDPRIMTFREEVYYAETGPTGDYQVEVPPNSPYIVSAEASGYQPQTYMQDSEKFWFGTPVDVAPGAVTPDIDITLYGYPPPQEMEWLAGIVSRGPAVSNNDSPLPGAIVRLQSATGFGYERIARTDERGQFSFHGLPGFESYILSVEAEGFLPVYYPAAFTWPNAEPVHSWPVNARVAPLRIQLTEPASDGPHFVVGVIRGEGGGGGVPIDPPPPGGWGPGDPATGTGGGPPDTTDWVWGLPGAFLYLVPADDAGTPGVRPVAGATACDNGTVLIENVPAGRYKAYADRPGYQPTWFHGTGPLSAAVISVGPGIDPIVVDIVMNPVDIVPPPGGGGEVRDAEARIVTNLHNSPNPFQPATTIIYRLMDSAPVSLEIYDVNGRLVRRMFDRVSQPAGEQHVPWDGRKDGGEAAGAGIYFYRVWTPTETSTGKMVRVR